MDYMWLTGRKEEGESASNGNPILVMHCRDTKLTWSRVLMKKGVDSYPVKVGCDMISFTGCKKVMLKSDGEAAITALANIIKASCDLDMGVEVSPV
eukprot:3134978-Pyramimonas_sp.AAC.1